MSSFLRPIPELYNSDMLTLDYIGLLAECEKVLDFISVDLHLVIYHAIHYIMHMLKLDIPEQVVQVEEEVSG